MNSMGSEQKGIAMKTSTQRKLTFALVGWVVLAWGSSALHAGGAGVDERQLNFGENERSYFMYAADELGESAPVLILLHGSGRRGDSLIKPWKKMARQEGILLVAPNSADPQLWSPYDDPPSFFRAILADVEQKHVFDRSRVYLFGHSGGAVWALQLGLLSSQEITAVAVHAGVIPEPALGLIDQATRKTPMFIQVGSRDPFFPVAAVEMTVSRLSDAGFPIEHKTIPGHDHNYYRRAKKINRSAWDFLANHTLAGPIVDGD